VVVDSLAVKVIQALQEQPVQRVGILAVPAVWDSQVAKAILVPLEAQPAHKVLQVAEGKLV